MKKIYCLVLILFFVFSSAGCRLKKVNSSQFNLKQGKLSISSVPLAQQNVFGGASNVLSASIIFSADNSDVDIPINNIKLSGYVSAYYGTDALTKNKVMTPEGVLKVKDLVSAIRIYERAPDGTLTQLGAAKVFNSNGEAIFRSLAWIIPKKSSKTLLVMADIASGISTILNYDEDDVARVTVDIVDVSRDILIRPAKNTSFIVTGDYPNKANTPNGPQITIRAIGEIILEDDDKPLSGLVVAGSKEIDFGQKKFKALYEDFIIRKLRVSVSEGEAKNLSSALLAYFNSKGELITAVQEFNAGQADFTDLDIYVAKDKYTYVWIKANLKTIGEGAIAGTKISLSISATENFKAVGIDSMSNLTSVSTNNSTAGNAYIVMSKPTFATQPLNSYTIVSGVENVIYMFSITADSGADISFKQWPFQVIILDR
ncbi:hypothetical protein COV49_00985 [Candidatus Falkowbacteria bacterium CG11_big_fil_rev_8_21_14_0_20_39_10]|uniref:Uncharacterized protein n=1 Tax=Candidatus Falkowbacteria bacterium CG11_big_fil_rev_8_21_14_0_20_39_10 TaxID=1974570 RepID=A0A2M6K9Q1_9BACT|nr:MAG: hypothetical protein COV49_00985 [Candidatus Falkowbacteria bacterium CG11_big_fil_rev_8_21_14_0_20_39_10]